MDAGDGLGEQVCSGGRASAASAVGLSAGGPSAGGPSAVSSAAMLSRWLLTPVPDGKNCVFWRRAWCLCSLHAEAAWVYGHSVTLFLSLIYRFYLMFSFLACLRIFLFSSGLVQMVLVVRVRL